MRVFYEETFVFFFTRKCEFLNLRHAKKGGTSFELTEAGFYDQKVVWPDRPTDRPTADPRLEHSNL